MEIAAFFAGLQAFASFMQVWQTEQNWKAAKVAYLEKKEEAIGSEEILSKSKTLGETLTEHPVLGKLISNRFGRCEDDFEQALRSDDESMLIEAARAFVKCKCHILSAIRTAQGSLDSDFADFWDQQNCELVLREY